MTRVFGFATDPETGQPIAYRLVYAELRPATATIPAAVTPVIDKVLTDGAGRWELNLRRTTGTGAHYVVRVWLHATYDIDVPAAPSGNAALDYHGMLIDPDDIPPEPPPTYQEPRYIKLTEKGAPSGVATLGLDGLLTASQRPLIEANPSAWYAGDGPPPSSIPGAGAGDMYIDRLTGDLYQLV